MRGNEASETETSPLDGFRELTEEENAVYHRGRNAAGAHPKSASVNDYRRATGLEALFGYLHLKGDTARLDELFALFVSYLETNSEE